jgi:hypothetical protein
VGFHQNLKSLFLKECEDKEKTTDWLVVSVKQKRHTMTSVDLGKEKLEPSRSANEYI